MPTVKQNRRLTALKKPAAHASRRTSAESEARVPASSNPLLDDSVISTPQDCREVAIARDKFRKKAAQVARQDTLAVVKQYQAGQKVSFSMLKARYLNLRESCSNMPRRTTAQRPLEKLHRELTAGRSALISKTTLEKMHGKKRKTIQPLECELAALTLMEHAVCRGVCEGHGASKPEPRRTASVNGNEEDETPMAFPH